MARHKQATPLRREHSSEYTSSADRNGATPTKRSRNLDSGSVATPVKVNGHAANGAVVAPVAEAKKKQAGLLELVIGVSGIYASLYGPLVRVPITPPLPHHIPYQNE